MTALLVAGGLGACSGSTDESSPTNAEVVTALNRHAGALLGHDRAAFLDGTDSASSAAGFRSSQAAQFANLRHVPLHRWRYTLSAPVHAADAQASARARFGPSARIVKITLHVAVSGVDPVAATHSLWWTAARIGGRVVFCADDELARQGGVSWQGPWDFGPIAVVRGAHSLILGPAGTQRGLQQIADVVDDAVPAVTAVWGTDWSRDVEVVVPSTAEALAADLGEDTSGSVAGGAAETPDIAAVAVTDGLDPVTGRPEGQRVVVLAHSFDTLSPLGRRVVFTHEVAHIASAAATGGASPRWLVEGLAEYVGNLGTGQPVRVAASELVTQVGHRGLPRRLPADSVFDAATTAAAAYEQSWLACRLIASRVGASGLVRFYRQVGRSGYSTASAVSGAMRSVLHESTAQFVVRWRAYLRAQVG